MASWSEGNALVNGIRLHYYRTGGNKPAVVLCHGYSDNALCWSRLARELQDDYDVTMVDARCHGQSDAPADGNDTVAMAADLAALIEALGLDRPVLLGHSMGASYVFYAASRYPEALRAVALEDPVWRDEPPAGGDDATWIAQRRAEIARRAALSLDEIVAECRAEHSAWDEETWRLFAVAKQQLSPNILCGFGIQREPWRETLARIRCPMMVYTGDPARGAIVTDAVMNEAWRIAPQIQRAHIVRVGHHIRYERPRPYLTHMRGWLARIYA